jgi:hypothetical protein
VNWGTLGGPRSRDGSLSLWLQTPCCGHILWAFNYAHLSYLESYVEAEQRDRTQTTYGWSNSSLASRLPKWMIASKNRDDVLKAIKKLRDKI